MSVGDIAVWALLVLACTPLAACQSTQATSAEREANGAKLLNAEKGVKVAEASAVVEVVESTLLTDKNGTAVVAVLKNSSQEGLAKLPIAIDVKDAEGKSVFKNNLPGLDPALNTVPVIGPGETIEWVHDQVYPTATPASVKVKVGDPSAEYPNEPPEIAVSGTKLTKDVSGIAAQGEVETDSAVQQLDLTLFGVVRQGSEIIAAGRAGIKRLTNEKAADFNILFIGNPEGGDLKVSAPPSVLG